jgi:hypothetical protein
MGQPKGSIKMAKSIEQQTYDILKSLLEVAEKNEKSFQFLIEITKLNSKSLERLIDIAEHNLKVSRRIEDHSEEILSAAQSSEATLQIIADSLAPETLTASAPIVISGVNMANNTFVMNVGQSQPGVITPFLADGVTSSGGVVSATTVTFTDPSATFVLAPDNVTLTFTGVAANAAPVSGSVAFTVTDTDGVVSTWTDPITVSVSAVAPPPQQLTQSAPIVVGLATP